MSKDTEALNIVNFVKELLDNESNSVRDLYYSLEADTVSQAHPTHPWIEEEFYDGIRRVSITIEYKDGELVEGERKRLSEFMHNDDPKDFYE